ncbi:hypothetical protein Btru_043708 [Bulinus truncatus]|nr:hypothetical protein Btru_043708 [Bulinus truncatus]
MVICPPYFITEVRQKGHKDYRTEYFLWIDDASAGPPPRMPDGVKPLCGYVHPVDASKWMMYELVPGSGVYIHQENYNVALSKTRHDRPDGKAMARYLMSCFWRQSELVGASIAEPPKPYQKSLDRGIIHSILSWCSTRSNNTKADIRQAIWSKITFASTYRKQQLLIRGFRFCQGHSKELACDIRRTIQQKIGYAKFYFVKKTQDHDSPTSTPLNVEASPRRMSMEMARRGIDGMPLDILTKPNKHKKGRRCSESTVHKSSVRIESQLSDHLSSGDMLTDRLATDVTNRLSGDSAVRCMSAGKLLSNYTGHMSDRMSPACLTHHLPSELSARSSIRSSIDRTENTPLCTMEAMSIRVLDSNQRGPATSRGFLDMLNTMYPNN